MSKRPARPRRGRRPSGWDPVASWYDGWVGKDGSEHHRKLAIPAVMKLLDPKKGEHIIDIGCGQGVLAPYIHKTGAKYTGVDVSDRLLQAAEKRHKGKGRFFLGDARHLDRIRGLEAGAYDGAVFLLSIQDMDPLEDALQSAAWALKDGGRVVIVMTHPAFRIPRQSGWGWDENRKLQFRRIDRYLTPLAVPMKSHIGRQSGKTISFHRPLSAYINGLAAVGLLVDALDELPTYKKASGPNAKAENLANQEIPIFAALRARKLA